jgi:hypothetical protein
MERSIRLRNDRPAAAEDHGALLHILPDIFARGILRLSQRGKTQTQEERTPENLEGCFEVRFHDYYFGTWLSFDDA